MPLLVRGGEGNTNVKEKDRSHEGVHPSSLRVFSFAFSFLRTWDETVVTREAADMDGEKREFSSDFLPTSAFLSFVAAFAD